MLRVLPDPVFTVDAGGRLTPMTPAAAQYATALIAQNPVALAQIRRAAALARTGMAPEPLPISASIDGAVMCFQLMAAASDGEAVVVLRDVTAEASVREVLLDSRQRYKQLVEITADFVWECDETGVFSFISEPGAFGFPPNRIVGQSPDRFLVPGAAGADWPCRSAAPVRGREVSVRDAAGGVQRFVLDAAPIETGGDGRRGVRGIARQLTDERAPAAQETASGGAAASIRHAMQTEWQPAQMLARGLAAAIEAFGLDGCAVYGWRDIDRWTSLARAGEAPADDIADELLDGLREGRSRVRTAFEAERMIAAAVHSRGERVGALLLRGGALAHWGETELAVLSAIEPCFATAIQQALEMQRLTRLSRTDGLTGLLNRRAFLLELTGALARASRHATSGALFYVDLDQFKQLNDRCGHEAGNVALAEVGAILAGAIRPYDLAARLGGDEFALWLEDISARDAGRSARRIAQTIAARTVSLDPGRVGLGASIGVAMFDPDRPESPDDLIERADRAMYRAKRGNAGSVVLARARRQAATAARQAAE
ncbi:MAG: sensor domain-containing diguanylate cyclase [Alphaproteobacteria bacterium]